MRTSTPLRRNKSAISILCFAALCTASSANGAAIIDWAIEHQTMQGFGASNAFVDAPLTDAQADFYFTTDGIGLTWLRMGIASDGGPNGGAWSDATKAAARGARVWAAPWTAPANWKDNGSETNGGHLCANAGQGSCDANHYADWATRLAGFATSLKLNAGVDLYALSIQNEPDFTASYESMLFSNAEFVAFINVLGPKLAALNPQPLLMAGDYSNWFNVWGLASAIEANPGALANTGIYITHQYAGTASYQALARPLWQTEMSSFEGFDPTIGHGVTVAKWIHSAVTTGNVSVWHYWWLYNPYNADNEGLIGSSADRNAITKRAYTLGNYAKFVRPGWTRIEVSGVASGNLYATAYKGPNGNFAVVVANDSGGNLPFTADFAHAHVATVTPWITSATLNLSSQSSIAVVNNQLSATVPFGVTTFVGVNDLIFANGFE